MPRLLKLRVAALERVAHELRFAPAAAARRQTVRAEKLVGIVDPTGVYPEDFVVFQITGFRPEIAEPELIPGDALLRDLAALIDRLSRRAAFTRQELAAPQWLSVEELQARWNVSRKTIERLRTRGLIGRRVALERGRAMNVFAASVVKAVESREGLAGRPPAKARAPRKPRAEKAPPRKVVTPGDRRLVERALRAGVKSRKVAAKLTRSRATVFRSQQQQLAERCRAVRVAIPAGAAELIEAEGLRFIADPLVCTGLGAPAAGTLAEHVADALRAGWPEPLTERARAFAYWTLVARAQTGARELNRTRPSALAVDRIVTDLRWASQLKAELVRGEQMLLLRTIEGQVGTALLELPHDRAVMLLERCLAALSAAVDRFDPTGGRIAGVAGIELSRAVARWQSQQVAEGSAKAQPLAPRPLDDWTRSLNAWQVWTNPPATLRSALGRLSAERQSLLAARYGFGGRCPQDVQQLAGAFGKPARVITRLLHSAERQALAQPGRKRRRRKKA